LISDPLGLNAEFIDGTDIIILTDRLDQDVERISELFSNPEKLRDLGEATFRAFRRVMDLDRQLWQRTKIIADELCRHQGLVVASGVSPLGLDGVPLLDRIAALEAENARLRRGGSGFLHKARRELKRFRSKLKRRLGRVR
jgi:hypothetical protein